MKIVTDQNFQTEVLDQPLVLVDFFGTWCGPCKMLMPILEKIDGPYPVVKIDCDQSEKLATKYEINTLPTVILFKDGVAAERICGLRPEKEYRALIQKYSK